MNGSITFEFLCPQFEDFIYTLAKISLWSVWRDLREAKCVDLSGELYENLQIFVDLHSVSKVFKALRRLPKIKNFRIEEWRHA